MTSNHFFVFLYLTNLPLDVKQSRPDSRQLICGYVSYYSCCPLSHAALFLPAPQAPACSDGAAGQHSLFLFPMHIPLWDVTLKRHRAWENGAAEVFHRADGLFILLPVRQLTSKGSRDTTAHPGFQPVIVLERKSTKPLTQWHFCISPIRFYAASLITFHLCDIHTRWHCVFIVMTFHFCFTCIDLNYLPELLCSE